MTVAEKEEIEVRKRRAEGTPCTEENFNAWLERFEAENVAKEAEVEAMKDERSGKKKSSEKKDETMDRLTGFEQFSSKVGIMSLEAIEKAAEEAENESSDVDEVGVDDILSVDEELFDDDDDLDDLDFDSDEDDNDSEPDI